MGCKERVRLRAVKKANTKLRSQEFSPEPALGAKSARPPAGDVAALRRVLALGVERPRVDGN